MIDYDNDTPTSWLSRNLQKITLYVSPLDKLECAGMSHLYLLFPHQNMIDYDNDTPTNWLSQNCKRSLRMYHHLTNWNVQVCHIYIYVFHIEI